MARSPSWRTEKNDTKVSITIAHGKTQMDFAGVIDADDEYGPPRATIFDQPDLGYGATIPSSMQVARAGNAADLPASHCRRTTGLPSPL
jgi:hypothetical protein